MQRTPTYQIFYILQIPTPFVLSMMYMPFVSLFAAFALFGKAMLQILAYKLACIGELEGKGEEEEEKRYQKLTACIRYHINIIGYARNSIYIRPVPVFTFGNIFWKSALFSIYI